MKLLFPNGEHSAVELKQGLTTFGSSQNSDVVIIAPGIAPNHCKIELHADTAKLILDSQERVVVINGRQVVASQNLNPGDLVLFGKVGARVVNIERAAPVLPTKPKELAEDDGATRVRMALPRFMLRGVSGHTFGKTFPLFGSMTIGRNSDCQICIPLDEVSRHHAKLQVMPDGVAVEDLASANGTFVNNKRVHQGMLRTGEELRLDTVRFLLVAPGADQVPANAAKQQNDLGTLPGKSAATSWVWLLLGAAVAGVAIAALWYLGVIK